MPLGVTFPSPPPNPYQPFATTSPLRIVYQSLVNVLRLTNKVTSGMPSVSWAPLTDVIDPYVGVPGQMMCRLDLGFIKRGAAQPMPLVAGRAPDRVGVAFFDAQMDPETGAPFVLVGDRLQAIAGPVQGTFDIRIIPTAALDITGAHHIEVEIIEVAQSLAKGSLTPFPGSEGPDT